MEEAGDEGFGAGRLSDLLGGADAPGEDAGGPTVTPKGFNAEIFRAELFKLGKDLKREHQRLERLAAQEHSGFGGVGHAPAQTEEGGVDELQHFRAQPRVSDHDRARLLQRRFRRLELGEQLSIDRRQNRQGLETGNEFF